MRNTGARRRSSELYVCLSCIAPLVRRRRTGGRSSMRSSARTPAISEMRLRGKAYSQTSLVADTRARRNDDLHWPRVELPLA